MFVDIEELLHYFFPLLPVAGAARKNKVTYLSGSNTHTRRKRGDLRFDVLFITRMCGILFNRRFKAESDKLHQIISIMITITPSKFSITLQ